MSFKSIFGVHQVFLVLSNKGAIEVLVYSSVLSLEAVKMKIANVIKNKNFSLKCFEQNWLSHL